jgi:dTDP-4-dehydrorhamnose 3,5-epimerase
MKFENTRIDGAYIIEHDIHKDSRGSFVKTFHKKEFLERGIEWNFCESYYTRSKEDVIRGMHFQTPPHDHAKLVTIILGTVVDVILDLRKSSPSFGEHIAVELSRENRKSIYIPRGCAHGFSVLGESAIVYYKITIRVLDLIVLVITGRLLSQLFLKGTLNSQRLLTSKITLYEISCYRS